MQYISFRRPPLKAGLYHPRSVLAELMQYQLWLQLTLLLIVETIVFSWLRIEPSASYVIYAAETKNAYESLFAFIFTENIKSMLITIFFGTIPFGFGVIFTTYMTITGLVSTAKWLLPQFGIWKLLLCTLPHGLFEIPAICFSIFLSVLWCRTVTTFLIRLFFRKPCFALFSANGLFVLKCFLLIQLPLTLIAALMEVTISQWVVGILP